VQLTGTAKCECGKRMYPTRRDAVTAKRQLGHNDLRPYRCRTNTQYWHLGHLAPGIIAGTSSRAMYDPPEKDSTA
jgi:hypothetical protein